MKTMLISTAAAATLLLSGCAGPSSVADVPSENVYEAIKKAEVKYDKLGEEGVIPWKKTKGIIAKSKEHLKEAVRLAKEAQYEADTALAESKEYEKTWRNAVPK